MLIPQILCLCLLRFYWFSKSLSNTNRTTKHRGSAERPVFRSVISSISTSILKVASQHRIGFLNSPHWTCHHLPLHSVMPDVRIPEREERRLPRQCNSHKREVFIADSSQGSRRASNSVVRGQRALSPSCYPIYKVHKHKQLVAGLSGLVTWWQSNLIGPNLGGLFFQTWALAGFSAFPW